MDTVPPVGLELFNELLGALDDPAGLGVVEALTSTEAAVPGADRAAIVAFVVASGDSLLAQRCAQDPTLPVEVLSRLCVEATNRNLRRQRRDDTARRLAANPTLAAAPVHMYALAAHTDVGVRSTVASHPGITRQILELLAHDGSAMVRRAVADNPATPPELLSRIATDT